MVHVHNFSYGLLNPGLAYLTSCLGCFLGLQCTARARAMLGAQRARWLLLAAVSIGVTGIWVMHFIAMLGYTIPGQIIHFNIPITIASTTGCKKGRKMPYARTKVTPRRVSRKIVLTRRLFIVLQRCNPENTRISEILFFRWTRTASTVRHPARKK